MEGEFYYAKQTRSTSWITNCNSFTYVDEELFFFFCMLWIEGELHYTRGINILLLLHSQSGGWASLYKRNKYSSSPLFLEWKETRSTSWIQSYNSFTDVEEEIFFFFCMLWMEEELNYTREINILLLLHSHHPDISLSIYKRRKKFFFFYILRVEGEFQ